MVPIRTYLYLNKFDVYNNMKNFSYYESYIHILDTLRFNLGYKVTEYIVKYHVTYNKRKYNILYKIRKKLNMK